MYKLILVIFAIGLLSCTTEELKKALSPRVIILPKNEVLVSVIGKDAEFYLTKDTVTQECRLTYLGGYASTGAIFKPFK